MLIKFEVKIELPIIRLGSLFERLDNVENAFGDAFQQLALDGVLVRRIGQILLVLAFNLVEAGLDLVARLQFVAFAHSFAGLVAFALRVFARAGRGGGKQRQKCQCKCKSLVHNCLYGVN